MEKLSKNLKRNLVTALIAVICTFGVLATATYAWYIYNTNAHTTNVHMAAGTGANMVISNSYDGNYGSSTVLESFVGVLIPVSTDRIQNGFQRAAGYTYDREETPRAIASFFEAGEETDFYKTTLFIKNSAAESRDVYVSGIEYEDDDAENPLSTAIRVGLVVHKPGYNQPVDEEFIFEINKDKNPEGLYNTEKGKDGDVLDSTKTDGSTVEFTPFSSENFCIYDTTTGNVTLMPESQKICEIVGGESGYGEPVQIDVYIWLEGCDSDCNVNLVRKTIRNLAISFAETK